MPRLGTELLLYIYSIFQLIIIVCSLTRLYIGLALQKRVFGHMLTGPDRPARPGSLISVFTVRLQNHLIAVCQSYANNDLCVPCIL